MKTIKTKINQLPILILLFAAACTQQPTKDTQAENPTTSSSNSSTNPILTQYLKLKDALVASNSAQAKQAAATLLTTLKQSQAAENTIKTTDSIAQSTDIAQQRTTFTNLSNQLINTFKKTKPGQQALYIQYCPMANEGNGGYWLSAEQEIRNPYYGDEMLSCGEVKETIK